MQKLTDPFARPLKKQRDELKRSYSALDKADKEAKEWPEVKSMIVEEMTPTLDAWRGELKRVASPNLVPAPIPAFLLRKDRGWLIQRVLNLIRIIYQLINRFNPILSVNVLRRQVRRTKNFGGVPWHHPLSLEVRYLRFLLFMRQLILAIIAVTIWVLTTIGRAIVSVFTFFWGLLVGLWNLLVILVTQYTVYLLMFIFLAIIIGALVMLYYTFLV